MDDDAVRSLLFAGETLTVEFKSDHRQLLGDDEIVEAIVCLANTNGGTLLLGVEDNGSVTGVHGSRNVEAIGATVFNRTNPSWRVAVERRLLDGKPIAVIKVPRCDRAILATSSGKCVHRVQGIKGPECRPFPPSQHTGRLTDLGLLDYSAAVLHDVAPSAMDDLALAGLRALLRPRLPSLADLPAEDVLASLELTSWISSSERRMTIAGLLCVGNEETLRRYIPTHEVAFQVFDGDELVVNRFFHSPLIPLVSEMEAQLKALIREREVQVGLVQIRIPDYPMDAVREAFVNALVHRDYSQLGAIHVQVTDDALSVSSPGGFLGGIDLDNLLVHEPRPRNPTLANAFVRLGLAERSGRGIDRIFASQLRWGRPAPDYSQSDGTAVRLAIPGGRPSTEFFRVLHSAEASGPRLSVQEFLFLNHLARNRTLSLANAVRLGQQPEGRTLRTLDALVDRGLVEPMGSRPPGYRFTPEMDRRLRPAASKRGGSRGEVARHVFTIGRQVLDTGSVTRRETAELCRIHSEEAKAILTRMRIRELLVIQGSRRLARYTEGPALKEELAKLESLFSPGSLPTGFQ